MYDHICMMTHNICFATFNQRLSHPKYMNTFEKLFFFSGARQAASEAVKSGTLNSLKKFHWFLHLVLLPRVLSRGLFTSKTGTYSN